MERKVLRNKKCVAFRGDTQECIKLLEDLGYKYNSCTRSLPKDYKDKALIITFYGGSYSITNLFPHPSIVDQVFDGRIVPRTFEEFKNIVSEYDIITLK